MYTYRRVVLPIRTSAFVHPRFKSINDVKMKNRMKLEISTLPYRRRARTYRLQRVK